jgi:hypothetical protein
MQGQSNPALSAKMIKLRQSGEDIWKNKVEKINGELFTLTYGSLVAQLLKDFEDYAEVNKQLEKMYTHSLSTTPVSLYPYASLSLSFSLIKLCIPNEFIS